MPPEEAAKLVEEVRAILRETRAITPEADRDMLRLLVASRRVPYQAATRLPAPPQSFPTRQSSRDLTEAALRLREHGAALEEKGRQLARVAEGATRAPLVRFYQRAEVRLVREKSAEPFRLMMDQPQVLAKFLRPLIHDLPQENFVEVLLDARRRMIGVSTVSVGGVTQALVEPRDVFRPAIVSGADSIVVAHNHPSGDWTPSAEDVVLTRRLEEASEVIGVPILDHIVIGGDGFFSFAQHGLIGKRK